VLKLSTVEILRRKKRQSRRTVPTLKQKNTKHTNSEKVHPFLKGMGTGGTGTLKINIHYNRNRFKKKSACIFKIFGVYWGAQASQTGFDAFWHFSALGLLLSCGFGAFPHQGCYPVAVSTLFRIRVATLLRFWGFSALELPPSCGFGAFPFRVATLLPF